MTEYSDSSLREDESAGAAPSALRPCASRGDSLNANIFDQAGDVIEQVKGQAEELLEKTLDRMGLSGVPCDPRGPGPRERVDACSLEDINTPRTAPAGPGPSAIGSPYASPRLLASPSPQAQFAADVWSGRRALGPGPEGGAPSRDPADVSAPPPSGLARDDSLSLEPLSTIASCARAGTPSRVSFVEHYAERRGGFSPVPGASPRSPHLRHRQQ